MKGGSSLEGKKKQEKRARRSHNELENLGEVNLAAKLKFWITYHCEIRDKTEVRLSSTLQPEDPLITTQRPAHADGNSGPTLRNNNNNSCPQQQNTVIILESRSLFSYKHHAIWQEK